MITNCRIDRQQDNMTLILATKSAAVVWAPPLRYDFYAQGLVNSKLYTTVPTTPVENSAIFLTTLFFIFGAIWY